MIAIQIVGRTMASLSQLSQELSSIVAEVGNAVVAVHGNRYSASGIHWQPGLIVTSYESVNLDDKVCVTLPQGETVEVNVVGSDPSTDIAVLRLPSVHELPVPNITEASPLGVGSFVLGIGRVSGTQRSPDSDIFASFGIVQTLGEPWRSSSGGIIDRRIEVDLRLSRHGAGGPLVDAEGRIVGFNTFGPRRSVLTIPTSTINRVVTQLCEKGRIPQAYLGIGMQSVKIPEALQSQFSITNRQGLMVVSLEPQQAAEQGGILLGDILISLNDRPIGDSRTFQFFLDSRSIGQPLAVHLIRGGELRQLEVTVGER
jgi:S1-C subfamily serine protease